MTSQVLKDAAPAGAAVSKQHMAHELDGGLAGRARLGLIVLATDHTIEHEFHRVLAGLEGVTVYGSRLYNDPQITPETLALIPSTKGDLKGLDNV